jgi:hypothetical protein
LTAGIVGEIFHLGQKNSKGSKKGLPPAMNISSK